MMKLQENSLDHNFSIIKYPQEPATGTPLLKLQIFRTIGGLGPRNRASPAATLVLRHGVLTQQGDHQGNAKQGSSTLLGGSLETMYPIS